MGIETTVDGVCKSLYPTGFPYLFLYWNVGNGMKIDYHLSGRDDKLPFGQLTMHQQFISTIEYLFGCYVPTTNKKEFSQTDCV